VIQRGLTISHSDRIRSRVGMSRFAAGTGPSFKPLNRHQQLVDMKDRLVRAVRMYGMRARTIGVNLFDFGA